MTTPHQQPRSFLFLQVCALALAGLFCVATGYVIGYRADILYGWSALPFDFSITMSFCVLFLLAALYTLRHAAAPRRAETTYIGFFLVATVFLMTAVLIEVALTPLHILRLSLLAHHPLMAIAIVTVYGLAGVLVLLPLLRLYHPASRDRAAAWIGITAAIAGGLGYAVYSQSTSPLFYLIAFGVPCLLVASASVIMAPVLVGRHR